MDKVLVVGDLHISDIYVGNHKDYWGECIEVLSNITKIIVEQKITHLVLTGDLVGLQEKTFKSIDSRIAFMLVLKRWNELTNNNVYSVIGNHDLSGKSTEFNLLESLGYIKTTNTIGTNYFDVDKCRFHLIDYGAEEKPLTMGDSEQGYSNLGITHNDIQVTGYTTWYYPSRKVYELSSMANWKGLSLILAGHIHNPSPMLVKADIEGKTTSLFYLGCPTRPKRGDTWDKVYYCIVAIDENGADVTPLQINLTPYDEVFVKTTVDIEEDGVLQEEEPVTNIEELAKILGTLTQYKLDSDGDIPSQIKVMAGVDTPAMNLALDYYNKQG